MNVADLPTIVLVVLDTARWDRFGCYGYGRPTTPTVDSLASAGLRVDTMIANAPWTLPSHGSLFTGLYPSEHGSQWRTGPKLRDSVEVTMAEWLRSVGYDTWCVTNNGLISARTGLARGFDRYAFRLDVEQGWRRSARRIPKALVGGDSGGRVMNSWMRRALPRARRPLFLFVNYVECHWSYAPPPRFARRVGGPRYGLVDGLRYRTKVAARVGPWEGVAGAGPRDLEVLNTYYDGELANVDAHLDELLDLLRRTGHVRDDGRALVLVTSDHGEHLGEHERRLADHQASLDDDLLRVPFIAWGPGVIDAGEGQGVRELVDVLPSLARLLGREPPAAYLADRRADLFDATGAEAGDRLAFAEWTAWSDKERARLARRNPSYDFSGLARDLVGVRDSRFTLVRASDGTETLIDHARDEETDVAAEHPEDTRRLREALDAKVAGWRPWLGEAAAVSEDEQREIEQRLSELGYI